MYDLPIWKIILYSVLCACADGLDIIFSALSSSARHTDNVATDIDNMSDEEILNMERVPAIPDLDPLYPHTFWLGDNLVGKMTSQLELQSIEFVRMTTNIPVPRIRRVIQVDKNLFFLAMDRIKGRPLSDVWNELSLWRKLSVAIQLRRYIIQLRRFTKAPPGTPPGPLSAFGARTCDNPRAFSYMDSIKGPFETYADLVTFLNDHYRYHLDEMRERCKGLPPYHQRFNDSDALIFCHQDLTPRSMILTDDGRVWLVDWGDAGYYPPWFELKGMISAAWHERSELNNHHQHWELIVPFVCGRYFEKARRLGEISWTFDRPASIIRRCLAETATLQAQ